jgi:hypothetical protein
MDVNQLVICDLRTVGPGNVNRYTVLNTNVTRAFWEVKDPYNAKLVNGTFSGSNYSFVHNADTLGTYVAFNNNQLKNPVLSGKYLG